MSDDERTTNPNRTVVTVVGPPKKADPDQKACLVVIYGDDLGRRIELANRTLTLGRSSACEVQIDQESVSRNHCQVSFRGGAYEVRDLGSTNGTYVNDPPIDSVFLRDGDQLKVGRTILKFILGSNVEGQYHEVIYRLMTTDGLTQVHNKRYFDERLDAELRFAHRHGSQLALLMIDVDHFKRVNDQRGHLVGDTVLTAVAQTLARAIRNEDVVARVGGEEFVVILRATALDQALLLGERLRRKVEELRIEHDGGGEPLRVTVSIGAAAVTPGVGTADELVGAADRALYAAKQAGRNRVGG